MAANRRTEMHKMILAAMSRAASAPGPLEDLEADEEAVPFPWSAGHDDDPSNVVELRRSAMEALSGSWWRRN